jgi:ataxin-3
MPVYIYHELQDSLLCGQHCLNNLLQDDFFSAVNLGEIAQELDDKERAILGDAGAFSPAQSGNVDEAGNFSIQVLRLALERYSSIDLVPWHFNSEGEDSDPLNQQGFVVNRSSHWFSIRKVNDKWWNLNSTLDKPELISQFYLSALLHQLRSDGYSVFIAKGNLPVNTTGASSSVGLSGDVGKWYTEDQLLGKAGANGAAKPSAFTGTGYRLGGDAGASPSNVNMQDFRVIGDDNDEELMLAQAISASMADNAPPAAEEGTFAIPSTGDPKKDEAALIRAKRLAALEKRGL